MRNLKVTARGRLTVEPKAAADAVARIVVEHIRARSERGLDASDQPMPAYSPLYRRQLQALGEDVDVDVRRSGALMRGLKLLRVETRAGATSLVFGVEGNARETRPARPPPWVFAGSPDEVAKSLARWRRSTKKPDASLPLRERLCVLQQGQDGSRPRFVLGVSPRGRPAVLRALERARIFRST